MLQPVDPPGQGEEGSFCPLQIGGKCFRPHHAFNLDQLVFGDITNTLGGKRLLCDRPPRASWTPASRHRMAQSRPVRSQACSRGRAAAGECHCCPGQNDPLASPVSFELFFVVSWCTFWSLFLFLLVRCPKVCHCCRSSHTASLPLHQSGGCCCFCLIYPSLLSACRQFHFAVVLAPRREA